MDSNRLSDGPIVHEVEVCSLSTFVSLLDPLFKRSNDRRDTVLFRGQSEDKPLLPKIARLLPREDNILEVEQDLLADFKMQAPAFLNHVPDNDWDWLSIAQHYGLATRLLDWTTNALIAMWFAVNEPSLRTDQKAVVWVFFPKDADLVRHGSLEIPFSLERTKVFRPKHIAPRIAAQSGWFTVHKFLNQKTGFLPFENNNKYKPDLKKITIPSRCFSDIRRDLDQCGINAMSVLTDLSGLCRHIVWSHSLLEDELFSEVQNLGSDIRRRVKIV